MEVSFTLGSTSVQSVGRTSAHEFPLNIAMEVAIWDDEAESNETTSLSAEYTEVGTEKLKATPGYESTYVPLP
jgi:hypothetical protein